MEAIILYLLLGWLAVCLVLSISVTIARQRRRQRSAAVAPAVAYNSDTAPMARAIESASA